MSRASCSRAGPATVERRTMASPLLSSGMPRMAILRSVSLSSPMTLLTVASTVSCGTISPAIFEKREMRPSM